MLPTVAELQVMPWGAKRTLANRLHVHESRLTQRISKHHKLKAANRRYKARRAAELALDVQPDHHVKRCGLCGSWTLGTCTVNHGWRP